RLGAAAEPRPLAGGRLDDAEVDELDRLAGHPEAVAALVLGLEPLLPAVRRHRQLERLASVARVDEPLAVAELLERARERGGDAVPAQVGDREPERREHA